MKTPNAGRSFYAHCQRLLTQPAEAALSVLPAVGAANAASSNSNRGRAGSGECMLQHISLNNREGWPGGVRNDTAWLPPSSPSGSAGVQPCPSINWRAVWVSLSFSPRGNRKSSFSLVGAEACSLQPPLLEWGPSHVTLPKKGCLGGAWAGQN